MRQVQKNPERQERDPGDPEDIRESGVYDVEELRTLDRELGHPLLDRTPSTDAVGRVEKERS